MRLIGNVEEDAQVRAVASGALANGDTVVVNSDGTVSVVASTPAGGGTPVVFESADTTYTSATFDSNSNKVVIAYRDVENSNYGTAVVGTVSNTSISFGTPVVFEAASSVFISATFDSNSNKVVIAYRDAGNSNYGTAIVGTVSGTSISFGTAVVFVSTRCDYPSATFDSNSNKVVIAYWAQSSNSGTAIVGTVSGTGISFGTPVAYNSGGYTGWNSAVFDSNSNKVVIAYRDGGNSNYGTAIVGTVSGTGISFGSEVVFESVAVTAISAVFDSNSNKVVIAYANSSAGSQFGTTIVGTVSGTGISFGTAVVFENANTTYISAVFDSSSNKVIISFDDSNNSDYGTAVIGTVSGTGISFGDAVVFESAAVQFLFSTFDSNANKVVISYRDTGNSNYGTAVVFSQASTNLTAENFLGFAAHTYADTQSAVINSTCTVDRNQSGLTAGQTYYVQTDGSLGTTAADPSVVAGTAISSTEIIVKG